MLGRDTEVTFKSRTYLLFFVQNISDHNRVRLFCVVYIEFYYVKEKITRLFC